MTTLLILYLVLESRGALSVSRFQNQLGTLQKVGWRRDGEGMEEGWRRDGGGMKEGWRRDRRGIEFPWVTYNVKDIIINKFLC